MPNQERMSSPNDHEVRSATEPEPRVREPIEPDEVVEQLLDRLFWIGVVLGLLATLASLNRWRWEGWHSQHLVHLGVYLLLLAGLLLGRRLPRNARVAFIVGPLALNGLANLLWHGLAGTGLLFLAVSCILVVLFSGLRAALVSLAAATGALVAVGVAIVHGILPTVADASTRLRSPTNWLAQGIAFLALVAGSSVCADAIQRAWRHSTRRLHARTHELEREAQERQRIEAQLAEREEKYRLLAENSRDIVFTQDLDLRLTYLSPAAERLTGTPVEELQRLGIAALMPASSLTRAAADYQHHLALARTGQDQIPLMEYEYVRRDGTPFWGELHLTFLRDAAGEITGAEGILRDVSERKRLERERVALQHQLDQAERLRALGQLAGGIAHDFNNQLAGIVGYAELMKRDLAAVPNVENYAEAILVPAQRAAELTAKLLAFARSSHQRRRRVDLHELVREVIGILERSIDKRITLHLALDAPESVVEGDPTLLQSALLNLALNARDALPNGGRLEIRTSPSILRAEPLEPTRPQRPGIAIAIRDDGLGMNEETQRRAFEPFFTTKPTGKGTGMGLPAVHGTLLSHGGTVTLASEPGAGTTVTLTLPLAESRGDDVSPTAPAVVTGHGSLLVIDDEPDVRRSTTSLLTSLGYDVIGVAHPTEAIATYRSRWQQLDLVLLDLVLPQTSGAAVFAALREVNPAARILLMSGFAPEGAARALLTEGASGFLQKPFTLADLSHAVARALASPPSGASPQIDSGRGPTPAEGGSATGAAGDGYTRRS